MTNQKFFKLLREREMTATLLAELADVGRSSFSETINNKPGRGSRTRRKIFPWILPAEAEALGWRAEYMAWLRGPALNLQVGAAMRSEENSEGTEVDGEGNTAPTYRSAVAIHST